ncbi:MAG TPA: transposase [Longimicrobium sp.]|nr:transposase [Longimicrobium sp.]
MPTPDGSAQLPTNVESWPLSINTLASSLPGVGRVLALKQARQELEATQDQFVAAVREGRAELVCERCGVVHSGPSILRRGSRLRKLKTSTGVLEFELKQLTCRDCRRTWSPFAELLGLAPRQRVARELVRKLVECVTELPYGKTCRLAAAWLGASLSPRTLHACVQELGSRVRFTPAPATAVVLADGTKVPAGRSERGMEVRFSFQILSRHQENGRTAVQKRIAGWGVGPGGWKDALPARIATEVIVTDREKGLPKLLAKRFPKLRHQHCEWHLGHTLNHLLYLDGVKLAERKPLKEELGKIVWGRTITNRRERYASLCSRLAGYPKAHTMLVDAQENVLFDVPSRERTTSVIEREMREINRRSDVGVRWSERGIDNLLRLRAARRINKDDFERVW